MPQVNFVNWVPGIGLGTDPEPSLQPLNQVSARLYKIKLPENCISSIRKMNNVPKLTICLVV